jgi:CDP-diacylglycerol--glycerol-3-phosphate 3-phosphatidyltransferase/archaetidylinositol phosphate synthase
MSKVEQQLQQRRRVTYEEVSIPYGKFCLKLGLTPNILTFISFLVSCGAGILFWQKQLLWGGIVMGLAIFADMLDGATARAGNLGTQFGGILDHVSDRYAEAVILMGISLSGVVHPIWPMFALFGMIIASYTREAAESIGHIDNVAVGAVGRLEKFIIIIAGSIAEYFLPNHDIFTYSLILVGLVSYLTSVQRLFYARRILRERKRGL